MPSSTRRAKPTTTVGLRALNRAFLARQSLLDRAPSDDVVGMVRHLVALQAQLARPPFVALWSRLASFDRERLLAAVHARTLVRATAMRGTIHLMATDDYCAWHGLFQPQFDRAVQTFAKDALGIDPAALEREGRAFFARPATFDDFRRHLLAARPEVNERALAFAVRMRVPLVQVPTSARWGWPAAADFALADHWVDRAISCEPSPPDGLITRYLEAFGPATVADAQGWTGIGTLRPAFDSLRDGLIVLCDDQGREHFDLPDAPRPDADVEAPIRFLPEYDNVILGHHERSRIVQERHRPFLQSKNLIVPPTFLVDGMVAGTWKHGRRGKVATLELRPFSRLAKATRAALEAEAGALLRFVEEDATAVDIKVAS